MKILHTLVLQSARRRASWAAQLRVSRARSRAWVRARFRSFILLVISPWLGLAVRLMRSCESRWLAGREGSRTRLARKSGSSQWFAGGLWAGYEPRLEVSWAGDWKDFREKLRVLRAQLPVLPAGETRAAFRDAAVEWDQPRRGLLYAVTLHALLLFTPMPEFLTRLPVRPAAFTTGRIEYDLRWARSSEILPPIFPTPRPERKPGPGGEEAKPLPPPGADVVQAQTIVSSPPQPNHPYQTLLQQFGVEKSRVQAPSVRLPNVVIPPSPGAAPAAEMSLRRSPVPGAPLDLTGPPGRFEPPRPRSGAELALESEQLENLLPRLTLPSSAGARGPEAAPEVNTPMGTARSGDLATPGVIALSANPAIPRRVLQLPETNLRARFGAGPYASRGRPGGVPGGAAGARGGSGGGPGGGGLTAPDILVLPAGRVPPGPVIVGPEPSEGPPAPAPVPPPLQTAQPKASGAATAKVQRGKSAEERAKELLEAVRAGSQSPRRVQTTYAFIPNLTSQSSTWMLRYAEREPGSRGRVVSNGALRVPGIAPPRAVKKVDPCYPSDARTERVEGTVILYAVIRADGGVEDVTLVEGVQPQVDQSALRAFAQSLFEPARKNGHPIPVEVLVEIPFRLAPCL